MFTGYCDKLLAIFFVVNRLSFVSFVAAKLWQFSIRNKFFAAFRLKLLRQSSHFATNPQNGWKSCRKPHKNMRNLYVY